MYAFSHFFPPFFPVFFPLSVVSINQLRSHFERLKEPQDEKKIYFIPLTRRQQSAEPDVHISEVAAAAVAAALWAPKYANFPRQEMDRFVLHGMLTNFYRNECSSSLSRCFFPTPDS